MYLRVCFRVRLRCFRVRLRCGAVLTSCQLTRTDASSSADSQDYKYQTSPNQLVNINIKLNTVMSGRLRIRNALEPFLAKLQQNFEYDFS